MPFSVEAHGGHLRVEVTRRENPEEGRVIADAILSEQRRTGIVKILVVVRESDPIFRVEQYKLSEFLSELASIPGVRVALVSDSPELYASHQYVEVLAKQRGVETRCFRDEFDGLKWLIGESE